MAYMLGAVKPHVRAAADEVGSKYGVRTIHGIGLRPSGNSDHPRGLALDYMVYTDKAKGDAIAAYLQANAARLGITYIIWWQRIWNVARAGEGWRPMENRGSNTANHKDHVHASFSASGGSGGAPIDAAPAGIIDDTGAAIRDMYNVAKQLASVMAWLGEPNNWLRIAMFVSGATAILAGLISWDTVKTGATTVAKGVANAQS